MGQKPIEGSNPFLSAILFCQAIDIALVFTETIVVAERQGERGDLPADAFQKSVDVAGLQLGLVAGFVGRVLGGDAGDALADMALHAGDAAAGDDGGRAQGGGVGAKGQGLDDVDAVAQAAHQHDFDGLAAADLGQRPLRLADGGQGGNADIFHHLRPAGAGGTLHAVELDEIEAVPGRRRRCVI